jgi:phytoene synthase
LIALMRHEVEFARSLLRSGAALHELAGGRLRRDILMFAGGGLAILRAIEAAGYDVFHRRPELHKLDYLRLGWHALRGRVSV